MSTYLYYLPLLAKSSVVIRISPRDEATNPRFHSTVFQWSYKYSTEVKRGVLKSYSLCKDEDILGEKAPLFSYHKCLTFLVPDTATCDWLFILVHLYKTTTNMNDDAG